jgi:hypothetical protein
MAKAIGWSLVGAHYVNGTRYPGFVAIDTDTGKRHCFAEGTSILDACAALDRKRIDTRELRERLAAWIASGQGDVVFRLS